MSETLHSEAGRAPMLAPAPHPAYRHDTVWRASSCTPQERLARVAARRAFVEMKQCFMEAAAEIDGSQAALLRRQLRQADDVHALWQLHRPLLASLPPHEPRVAKHREALIEHLHSAFPDTGCDTEFAPL
jgi:hypothetical protein